MAVRKPSGLNALLRDSSGAALELLQRNVTLNGLASPELIEADVFQCLRKMRDQARSFDVIVLDPPKFAPTNAHAPKAARAYKDINLLALQLLVPGGVLVTFSCSGLVDRELFAKVIEGAARDAHRPACILESLGQPPDHPRKPGFAESEYLKGFVVGV